MASATFVSRLLGSLLLWQKLLLPLVALAAPAAVFAVLYLDGVSGRADAARVALEVGRVADALDPMLIHLSDHRGQMGSHFRGDADAKAQALESERRIDAEIATIDVLDKQLGAHVGLSEPWADIRRDWTHLKSRAFSLDETESRKQHVALIGKLTHVFHLLFRRGSVEANDSNQLVLMELVLDRLPLALAATADLRGRAASAVKGGRIPDRTKGELLALVAEVKDKTSELEHLIPSDQADTLEARELPAALVKVSATNGAFVSLLEQKVFAPDTPAVAFNEVFAQGTQALQTMQAFAAAGTQVLSHRLEADLQRAKRAQLLAIVIASSLLLIAAVIAWLITHLVAGNVRETVTVPEHSGAGQLNNRIDPAAAASLRSRAA